MKKLSRSTPSPAEFGQLLTPPQVAARLGIELVTLADWRWRKKGPAWLKIGRLVRYPAPQLEAWIASRQHDAT